MMTKEMNRENDDLLSSQHVFKIVCFARLSRGCVSNADEEKGGYKNLIHFQ